MSEHMRTRPWPIVILAILHILEPIFNILLCSWLLKASPSLYLRALYHQESGLQLAGFFLLPPIAGLAIFMVKEWSYPVFLATVAWVLYGNYGTWKDFPEIVSIRLLFATYMIKIGVVGYFLIPAVRAAYYNRRLRWWESLRRFDVQIPAQIKSQDQEYTGNIENFSEGGIFLKGTSGLEVGHKIEIHFSVHEQNFIVGGKVVHRSWQNGYGIQFENSRESRQEMKSLAKHFRRIGLRSNRDINHFEEFKLWWKTLFKTGKGLVPELPWQASKGAKKTGTDDATQPDSEHPSKPSDEQKAA